MKTFDEVFEDKTKYGTKIKASEYRDSGLHLIIDQGQRSVAGYTNLKEGLFEDVPAIIFGDHTRVVKYVDKPFFIGADGVKILKSKIENANYKYLYYALVNAKVPDTGYNRHFKWLREVKINYPELTEQQKIVDILDKIEGIISEEKQQLEELDMLVKARFVEMFGDTSVNPRGLPTLAWKDVFVTTTGKLDSNAMVLGGQYPFFTCAKEQLWIDQYAFDCEALLLAGNNAAGIYDVKHYKGKFNAYQRTYVLRLRNENWSYKLFQRQLEDKLEYLKSQSKGSNTRYLTLEILNRLQFIVPDIGEQQQFSAFVYKVEKLKIDVQRALDETQKLFNSLMQQYFG
ncbi:MAG: restriction endonuclease subunit S [Lachnoclostridium sp.]|nr:restriction endonuclease subunit S [Lachnospira sp.]MCM1248025.1 restriction endonuclease subunit S [Lachnoclostridium sp.]